MKIGLSLLYLTIGGIIPLHMVLLNFLHDYMLDIQQIK